MKILIACEASGVVRDAFIARGHEAVSCDLLPTEAHGPHYTGDVRDILGDGWDLLIAHPPCTYLCSSGLHWNKRDPVRQEKTDAALEFVRVLLNAPIPRIAVENPVGCIGTKIRPAEQIIQPWQFGHAESKTTCLWLKGLAKLRPTNILEKPASGIWENQTPTGQNKRGSKASRWIDRSLTYSGIAEAMADQWGREDMAYSPSVKV